MKKKMTKENRQKKPLAILSKAIVFFMALFLVPFLNYGQTSTQILNGYYNASANYGFSCNVQVQITKSINGNNVVFKSKLISAKIADNKGWYDNSTHRYFSCDIVGNYCVIYPQFLDVKTEYGNLPFDNYSFSHIGEEHVIYNSTVDVFKSVVGTDASTFQIPAISQTIVTHKPDAPIWDKLSRIRASGPTGQATSSITTDPGTSTDYPGATNPLPNSSSNTNNDQFTQDVQNATNVVNGIAQFVQQNNEERERKYQREQQQKEWEKQNKEIEATAISSAMPMREDAANKGDIESMFWVADNYRRGRGVVQDYDKAMFYFKKAADSGHTAAMLYIGQMYENGEGIDTNYTEAINWYLKSANAGDTESMYTLGNKYTDGKIVHRSYPEAIKWQKKGAEKGDINCMLSLSVLYKWSGDNKASRYWLKQYKANGGKL